MTGAAVSCFYRMSYLVSVAEAQLSMSRRRRSDLFERLRILMDDWAAYLGQGSAKDSEPSG